MNYITLLSIGYILFFSLYLICCSITNVTITNKMIFFPMLILTIAMALIAFSFYPKDSSSDINRHFFSYSCFAGDNGEGLKKITIAEKLSTGLFTWVGVILLAVKLHNPHYIPFFMVLLNYFFFALSCREICKKYNVSGIIIIFFFIVKVGLVSWFHVFSGLRNTCAFSILMYVIICLCSKGFSKVHRIILCCFLAVTIHPSSWIIVILIFFHKKVKNKKIVYFTLSIWSIFSMTFVKALSFVPFSSVQFIAKKLLMYYGFGADKALEWRIFLVTFVFLLLFFVNVLYLSKKEFLMDYFEKNYLDFLLMIGFFLVGSVLVPTMFMRFSYLIGFMALPVLLQTKKYLKKIDVNIYFCGELILCMLMCAYNWVALTSHMYLV